MRRSTTSSAATRGVLADGVTPFNNELGFSGIGYQALTVNLKYHF